MKIAGVAYGEKSLALLNSFVQKNNWFSVNEYAELRSKPLEKTCWATIFNKDFDIDVFVIISDAYIPYETLHWAEFCSLHGIKFRLNVDNQKFSLDVYCDYATTICKPKTKGRQVTMRGSEVDPLIRGLMRSSKEWKLLADYVMCKSNEARTRRNLMDKRRRDYEASRILYEFKPVDWKTIKRNARIFCLPSIVLELYNLCSSNDQHDVLHNNLVPEFTGYREFFRACWSTKGNWFISELLEHATYTPTGFKDTIDLDDFVKFWRPVYDLAPYMTDIEAATSISYFLLMGIAPELRDIHLQLIPKKSIGL